jgi:hypothetical protein
MNAFCPAVPVPQVYKTLRPMEKRYMPFAEIEKPEARKQYEGERKSRTHNREVLSAKN